MTLPAPRVQCLRPVFVPWPRPPALLSALLAAFLSWHVPRTVAADDAEGRELFAASFAHTPPPAVKLIGGAWEMRDGCLAQTDPRLDDPSKAVIVAGDLETWSVDTVFTARLRLDAWTDTDYARAGIGLCADPQSGRGLNLLFSRGRLIFMHDYVTWGAACTFAYRPGVWYRMKLCKTSGLLRGKAWQDGEPEPDAWAVTWRGFDAHLSGFPALVGCSGNAGAGLSTVSFAECRAAAVCAAPAECYAKLATWQETLAATGEAFARQDAGGAGPVRLVDLWSLLARDFPDARARREMVWEREDGIWSRSWPSGTADVRARSYANAVRPPFAPRAQELAARVSAAGDVAPLRALYYRSREIEEALADWNDARLRSLRLAVEDLMRSFPAQYSAGPQYLDRLARLERTFAAAYAADGAAAPSVEQLFAAIVEFEALHKEALLANPLLSFDRLLVVKRRDARTLPPPQLHGDAALFYGNDAIGFLNGLPINFQGNGILREVPFDNEIAVLSPVRPDGKLTTLYRPQKPVFVGDLRMDFDGRRLLFSSIGSGDRCQIFEIDADGANLRQVTRGQEADVDSYDACYLPGGRILFNASVCFQSVPCERRCDEVANFCSIERDGSGLRRLCFDQDHDFYPSVMGDGRVLYLRWEYTDIAHAFTGRLMTMNPDGTMQRAHYATSSFWPNRIFYARAVPEHPTKFVGIVTGHHGTARAGELVVFDVANGRRLAEGAVQRIPGHGKAVEARMVDNLVDSSWPKFLHPHPLSDKYFLAACQRTPEGRWGIWLVDVFDNMLLLCEEEGHVLFEPVPVRATPRPPVIPDRTQPSRRDATVTLNDIYAGEGMAGVPRGAVKKLRVFTYHFNYYGTSGIEDYVGMDGPWDIRRVLGTVPVADDGSAYFTVPANTPIAVQPLDAEGKALQLMRSWFTAMPGEAVSCVGCHEDINRAPLNARPRAPGDAPSPITPWHGPVRGFSWDREVQPVLDKYCVGCHDGAPRAGGTTPPDLRRAEPRSMPLSPFPFPPSFYALRRFVRAPGLEGPSTIPLGDYHADASPLVQMLRKGHHRVALDAEAWDRLATWIDMNAPAYGTWLEIPTVRNRAAYMQNPPKFFSNWFKPSSVAEIEGFRQRRIALLRAYGGVEDDPEAVPPMPPPAETAFLAPPSSVQGAAVEVARWPLDADQAARRQAEAGARTRMQVDLGEGVTLELALVPAGDFVMGDAASSYADEAPRFAARIERPFWIGTTEISNAQFRRFEPRHDSGVEPMLWLKWHPGHLPTLDDSRQPVCRVSWEEAEAFCAWLSRTTGRKFSLPDEAQWEWACRAGTDTALNYGPMGTDSAAFENLADAALLNLGALASMEKVKPFFATDPVDDRHMVAAPVGSFRPNRWGMCDMHGNAAEWTRSTYLPYPFRAEDERHADRAARKTVRGGSWYRRADLARAACRTSYRPWQRMFDVGFRVVCAAD